MRYYLVLATLFGLGMSFFGASRREAPVPTAKNQPSRAQIVRRAQSEWNVLEDCKLAASIDDVSYGEHTESDPLFASQGYLRLEAPPGSWGFIFADASVIPPSTSDPVAHAKYMEMVSNFLDHTDETPLLEPAAPVDLGFEFAEEELIPVGLEGFVGPVDFFATVMALPFSVVDPAYEAIVPNNPYNTVENSIRRFFQPIVANSSGNPLLRPWDADFEAWSSTTVDAPNVGAVMQNEWIRVGAGKTDKSFLDFRVLWELALTKKLDGDQENAFFNTGPQWSTGSWADVARSFGLRLRCQAVFVRTANPSPINSNPLTIGGLTGYGSGAQVSLGLSSFLQVNIQAAAPTHEMDRGIDIHTPGFTCYAGEETKIYAYGVTATASTLRFRKADATEFTIPCQRAGVGKIKFVIPEQHTGQMVIIRSQNSLGPRVHTYAATDIITVLP